MFYEIIYENGEHSIAEYADDEEARNAINAHVERAKNGLPGSPQSNPRNDFADDDPIRRVPVDQTKHDAQRVVKVLKYDDHPATYGETSSTLTVEVAEKTVRDCIKEVADKNGVVSVQALAAALLETTAPRVDTDPHDSNYKMKEIGELTGISS